MYIDKFYISLYDINPSNFAKASDCPIGLSCDKNNCTPCIGSGKICHGGYCAGPNDCRKCLQVGVPRLFSF